MYVNNEKSIAEYDYANNTAFKSITVTITIDGSDLVVGGPEYPTLTIFGPNAFNWAQNVTVINNGELTINGAPFIENPPVSSPRQIMVSDSGVLRLVNGATLISTSDITLYLVDSSSLIVTELDHPVCRAPERRRRQSQFTLHPRP